MKNLRILAAATLFALTSIAMLSGCGPLEGDDSGAEKNGQECTSATSCGDGYVCAEFKNDKGKCRVDCANAAGDAADPSKCSVVAGSTCKSATADLKKEDGTVTTVNKYYCAPSATANPNACKANDKCDTGYICDKTDTNNKVCVKDCSLPANASMCGEFGVCDPNTKLCVKKEFNTVVIRDVSGAEEAQCKAPNDKDAGADIVAVVLKNSKSGDAVGYAKIVNVIGGDVDATGSAGAVPYSKVDYPDGNAPGPITGSCIIDGLSNHASEFTSVGCGGGFTASFMKAADASQKITFSKGDYIEVYEYSSNQCAATKPASPTPEDKYQVWACVQPDPGNSWNDIEQNCVNLSGATPLEGFGTVTVGASE